MIKHSKKDISKVRKTLIGKLMKAIIQAQNPTKKPQ